MSRLTIDEVINHCRETCESIEIVAIAQGKNQDDITSKQYWEHYLVGEWLNELKKYEDAEEQGLLLKLPFKEVYASSGDIVYYIFDYEIVECINCGLSIDCDGKIWIALACDEHIFPYRSPIAEIDTDPTDWCQNTTEVDVDEWGKTVFLTKEEAEQKLSELN